MKKVIFSNLFLIILSSTWAQSIKVEKLVNINYDLNSIGINDKDEIVLYEDNLDVHRHQVVFCDTMGVFSRVYVATVMSDIEFAPNGRSAVFYDYSVQGYNFVEDLESYLINQNSYKRVNLTNIANYSSEFHPLGSYGFAIDKNMHVYTSYALHPAVSTDGLGSSRIKKVSSENQLLGHIQKPYNPFHRTKEVYDINQDRILLIADTLITVLDTSLNVLFTKKIQLDEYYEVCMNKDSHLMVIQHDTLIEYDAQLAVYNTYKLPFYFQYSHKFKSDSKGNLYITNRSNNINTLYKLSFLDVLTANLQTEALALMDWTKTKYGFIVQCPALDKVEICNMIGQKEVHRTPEFSTALEGVLIMKIYDQSGAIKNVKAYR